MTNTPGDEIYKDSEELRGPRVAKGGAFALSDIPVIKAALHSYVKTLDENDPQTNQIASLLHRLGRVGGPAAPTHPMADRAGSSESAQG